MSFRLPQFSTQVFKSLLGLPAVLLLVSSPIKAEAASLKVDRGSFGTREFDLNRPRDITLRRNYNRYGINFTKSQDFRVAPPANDTWEIKIGERQNGRREIDFNVFQPNRNQSWIFDLSVEKGNIELWFLDDLRTLNANEADKRLLKGGGTVRTSYSNLGLGTSTTRFVNQGVFAVRGRGKGTLTATAVPEPFSTTAAVGLAIAGVTRTLKKKKTDDA